MVGLNDPLVVVIPLVVVPHVIVRVVRVVYAVDVRSAPGPDYWDHKRRGNYECSEAWSHRAHTGFLPEDSTRPGRDSRGPRQGGTYFTPARNSTQGLEDGRLGMKSRMCGEPKLLRPWGGAGVRQVGLQRPQGLRMTGVGADEIGGVRNEIEIVV